ncbi:unnamed protein product [Adineta steineri]|uniref:Transmembrane protein n=2 Tax=Adineta steineri TaxID=433720 RepID=A0A814PPN7_9BILA|nr:unnamed protein product [Adineta steineri]CAF3583928.1 unnamed protein product [Adineta steineri]
MTPSDYDLYGIKVAMNDHLMVSVDNLNTVWYAVPVILNNSWQSTIYFNVTTCDFVYSVVVPVSTISSFIYNCIDIQGNNVIGFFTDTNNTFTFSLVNEQIVSNYSTQDNFIIDIDGEDTGVYGFADDFIFYYELNSTFELTIWPNNLNISPRAVDIGANIDYAIIVGYCQTASPVIALECGFIVQLNRSLACPTSVNELSIDNNIQFPYSDPRTNHHITYSRNYSAQTVLSVSIAWRTRRILIGIPSLNLVLLYSFDDPQNLNGSRQNGMGFMGFGKSVAWLNDQGEKAVIMANYYIYSTYQWISSAVHIYDIQSDGFSDSTQPILIYPNSQQVVFPWINPSFLRLVSSPSGHVTIFDMLGNPAIIYSAPANTYPNTNSNFYASILVPCIPGTYRNYSGIELCFPCPNGTYSSNCLPCTLENSFCPVGAVEEISYTVFKSIEQDQEYPESPESTVFDDLLMQNMFSFDTRSTHCILVSPITWVFVVITFGIIIAIGMTIHETFGPTSHRIRDWAKHILRKVDLIGEGQLWIGGLVSAAVVVLIVTAYVFSSQYLHRYPIELVKGDSSFACDVAINNAKFSTTTQIIPNTRSSKDIQVVFDMLNSQSFTLNIDFVQTAITCNDSLMVQRSVGYTFKNLTILSCQTTHNDSILSLAVLLPSHSVNVQLILPGIKTIGAIRLGLNGSSAVSADRRYTLMELNFASTFISSSLDQVLASSTLFSLQLTQIINRTAPLDNGGSDIYGAIWSSSFIVDTDELFSEETRYTLFKRTFTNITINIAESIFYVSNVQEPIARQTEIIFHNFLFTIVVLELFGLLFLVIKLLLLPVFNSIYKRVNYIWNRNRVDVIKRNLTKVVVYKSTPPTTNKPTPIRKLSRRWSSVISTGTIFRKQQ